MLQEDDTFVYAVDENGKSLTQEEAIELLLKVSEHPIYGYKDPVVMWTEKYVYFITSEDLDDQFVNCIDRKKETAPDYGIYEPREGRIEGHIYYKAVYYNSYIPESCIYGLGSVPRDPLEGYKAEICDEGYYGRDDDNRSDLDKSLSEAIARL